MNTISGQDSVQVVPVTPTEALLRPFYECPPDELPLAWAAMIKIAAAEGEKPAVQQAAMQAEVPQPVAEVYRSWPNYEIAIKFLGAELSEGTKLYATPAAPTPAEAPAGQGEAMRFDEMMPGYLSKRVLAHVQELINQQTTADHIWLVIRKHLVERVEAAPPYRAQVQPAGLADQLAKSVESIEGGHDPFCMSVLRGKDCDCGKVQPAEQVGRLTFEQWFESALRRKPDMNCPAHITLRAAWDAAREGFASSAQQQPVSAEAINAAAKVMAECMDYPWEHMPAQGREQMRKHAKAVLGAALTPPQAPGGAA